MAPPPRPERPLRQVLLELPPAGGPHGKPPRANLSAVALHGRTLFVGTDEGTVLDRLTGSAAEGFGAPEILPLEDALDLRRDEKGRATEIDIEGLDADGDDLWLLGSHSRTRGKPGDEDPIADLAELKHNPNRHILARLPLAALAGGGGDPAARRLPIGRKRGALTKALKADPHLAPFLKLPAKENGFDIEGIAAKGSRLLLGLRGPVLRGFAVVLEVEVEDDAAAPGLLALRPLGPDGRTWRKHFLDLDGNGVRDLHRDGDDVLILAGPTADLDGRCAIWRWREPLAAGADSFLPAGSDRLRRALRIPVGDGTDHPEGFALLPDADGGREVIVVYDSPAKARCRGEGAVLADVFALPGGAGG